MRTTFKTLQAIALQLNEAAGTPLEYGHTKDNGFKSNVGHYTVQGAYGGYQLQQVCNESGAVREVLGGGYIAPGKLADKMHSFLSGLSLQKKA